MNFRTPKTIIVIVFLIIVFSAMIFLWNSFDLSFHKTANTEKLSHYGDFISGILKALTLILVAYAYLATKRQVDLAHEQLEIMKKETEQAKAQTFDTTFFNFLQYHKGITERLQTDRVESICHAYARLFEFYNARLNQYDKSAVEYEEMKKLVQEMHDFRQSFHGRDFFDVFYNMLDKSYKWFFLPQERNNHPTSVAECINGFFNDNYFMIGHYIRSFMSILEMIDESPILSGDQKRFYASRLRDLSNIDELRLMIYVIIWRGRKDAKKWKALFERYGFMNYIGNSSEDQQLIFPDRNKLAFYFLNALIR